jgi:hypothetical protein
VLQSARGSACLAGTMAICSHPRPTLNSSAASLQTAHVSATAYTGHAREQGTPTALASMYQLKLAVGPHLQALVECSARRQAGHLSLVWVVCVARNQHTLEVAPVRAPRQRQGHSAHLRGTRGTA